MHIVGSCLNDTIYRNLYRGDQDRFLFGQFGVPMELIGLTMSVLNVMLGSASKKSGNIVQMISITDIIFFCLLIPRVLINLETTSFNVDFRYFAFKTESTFLVLQNCNLVFNLGLVALMSYRRRNDCSRAKTILLLVVNLLISAFIVAYRQFEYVCITAVACNGTQVMQVCDDVTKDRPRKMVKDFVYDSQLAAYVNGGRIAQSAVVLSVIIVLLGLNYKSITRLCSSSYRSLPVTETLECQSDKEAMMDTQPRVETKGNMIETIILVLTALFYIPAAVIHPMKVFFPMPAANGSMHTNLCMFMNFIVFAGRAVIEIAIFLILHKTRIAKIVKNMLKRC